MATSTDVQIQVSTDGRVPPGTADYARRKIGAVLRLTHRQVLAARVRVTRHGDPAVQHPVVAQANLDLSGRLVRAQAEGETAREAIDRLEDRLRHRVERIAQHWEARRGGMPSTEPHEWRHETERAHRHHWYPRPPQEREIVRHKSFTLHRRTIDEAADEMEMLGYDFHLFIESGTGQDAVIYRGGETGYRLAMKTPPGPHRLATYQLPLTISAQPAPSLTIADAVTRLNLLDLPFLFFRDADRSRCSVLYHRYDGHYGLITPADESEHNPPGHHVAKS